MGKICLLKAGEFILGLDTSNIISTLSIDKFKNEKTNEIDSFFLFLQSFLLQKPLDISGSELIVLKNKTNSKHITLLVDMMLNEIDSPSRFEPYPLLFPESAEKCCPKIFIHEDQIVLLLDPKQLSKTHKTLQTDHGLITLDDLLSIEGKIQVELKDVSLPQPEKLKSPGTSDTKQETTELEPEIKPVPESVPESAPEPEIDDKTIKTIIAWTFDEFNKFDSSEKFTISVDDLPHELIQQKSLSNESLQNFIDKIILQCEKTRYNTLKNSIKKKLKDINFDSPNNST
jgi:hypothetical protein